MTGFSAIYLIFFNIFSIGVKTSSFASLENSIALNAKTIQTKIVLPIDKYDSKLLFFELSKKDFITKMNSSSYLLSENVKTSESLKSSTFLSVFPLISFLKINSSSSPFFVKISYY